MLATVVRRGLALAAGLAALATVTGCGIAGGQPGSYDARQDVSITGCSEGDVGSVEAAVEISNGDRRERSYVVTAQALGADGEKINTLRGSINAVEPGESVTIEAVGVGFGAPAEFECELVSVDSVAR